MIFSCGFITTTIHLFCKPLTDLLTSIKEQKKVNQKWKCMKIFYYTNTLQNKTKYITTVIKVVLYFNRKMILSVKVNSFFWGGGLFRSWKDNLNVHPSCHWRGPLFKGAVSDIEKCFHVEKLSCEIFSCNISD